uniref:Uncharacterized protein n=1 Tax=Oryza glumipatula TaxID=40148 RepID=A0A0D9YQG1_9ORYZ
MQNVPAKRREKTTCGGAQRRRPELQCCWRRKGAVHVGGHDSGSQIAAYKNAKWDSANATDIFVDEKNRQEGAVGVRPDAEHKLWLSGVRRGEEKASGGSVRLGVRQRGGDEGGDDGGLEDLRHVLCWWCSKTIAAQGT